MTRLEINWPDEMAEQVRAAQGRIERAGASLREIPLDERLQLIAQVLKDWTSPDSTLRWYSIELSWMPNCLICWPRARLASWIDEQRARAVLSLRVDRAYCAENRWQGRFSVGGYGRFLQN